jgi:hypothetical protein
VIGNIGGRVVNQSGVLGLILAFLARSVGIWLEWNILYALPGDKADDYQEMLDLIPLLRHLKPPLGLSHLSLERFSPYFDNAAHFGIKSLRPRSSYNAVFPENADVAKIAYHFEGEYESGSKASPKLIEKLESEVNRWRHLWDSKEELPCLGISDLDDDCYLLLDTRGIPGTQELNLITAVQACLALTGMAESPENLQWGFDRKLVVHFDSCTVPLVTAEPILFQKFLREAIRRGRNGTQIIPQTQLIFTSDLFGHSSRLRSFEMTAEAMKRQSRESAFAIAPE